MESVSETNTRYDITVTFPIKLEESDYWPIRPEVISDGTHAKGCKAVVVSEGCFFL